MEVMVTITEAAQLLGIRSINMLKGLIKAEGIPFTKVGSRVMIPRAEVLRLEESQRVQAIREADRMWDEADETYGTERMTQDEMDAVSASRPGTLPWKRK